MKFISRLMALSAVILMHNSVSFADEAKFTFLEDFGVQLALTLPDRKTQVFSDFKITWNRQHNTVDLLLWDFYRGEEILVWVKANNTVFLGRNRDHFYYGRTDLFKELKARATSQTSHYVGCEKHFRI